MRKHGCKPGPATDWPRDTERGEIPAAVSPWEKRGAGLDEL